LRENTQGLCAGKGTAFSGRYKQKKRFTSTLIIFKQANDPLGHDGGASELPSPARESEFALPQLRGRADLVRLHVPSRSELLASSLVAD
jgi:hypothetical protein